MASLSQRPGAATEECREERLNGRASKLALSSSHDSTQPGHLPTQAAQYRESALSQQLQSFKAPVEVFDLGGSQIMSTGRGASHCQSFGRRASPDSHEPRTEAQSNMSMPEAWFCRSLSCKQAELTMIEWALEDGAYLVSVFVSGFRGHCASCFFLAVRKPGSGSGCGFELPKIGSIGAMLTVPPRGRPRFSDF